MLHVKLPERLELQALLARTKEYHGSLPIHLQYQQIHTFQNHESETTSLLINIHLNYLNPKKKKVSLLYILNKQRKQTCITNTDSLYIFDKKRIINRDGDRPIYIA